MGQMGLHRHAGLRWGMSFSDEACRFQIRHVGLWSGMSVSDGACQSPKGHVGLRWSMSRSPMGHWWGILYPMKHVGLRWVSDNNDILVNSIFSRISSFKNAKRGEGSSSTTTVESLSSLVLTNSVEQVTDCNFVPNIFYKCLQRSDKK